MTRECSGCGSQALAAHALQRHMHAHADETNHLASLGQYVIGDPPRLGTSEAVREPAFEAVVRGYRQFEVQLLDLLHQSAKWCAANADEHMQLEH